MESVKKSFIDTVVLPPINLLQRIDFFSFLIIFITLVVFSGFALNSIVHPQSIGRMTQVTMLHGMCSAAWYILLIGQLQLARSGKISIHKLLGKASVFLVMGILVTGVIMTLQLYDRLAGFGVFNPADASARIRAGGLIGSTFLQWGIFVVVYILALLNIRTPSHHKRFMLASAIQMMPEGLNRLIHLLELPGYMMLTFICGIYLCLFVYDWKTVKRVYWSSLVSFGLFILLATSIYTVFRSQFWGDWIVGVLNAT